jgi:hypothetical protein
MTSFSIFFFTRMKNKLATKDNGDDKHLYIQRSCLLIGMLQIRTTVSRCLVVITSYFCILSRLKRFRTSMIIFNIGNRSYTVKIWYLRKPYYNDVELFPLGLVQSIISLDGYFSPIRGQKEKNEDDLIFIIR